MAAIKKNVTRKKAPKQASGKPSAKSAAKRPARAAAESAATATKMASGSHKTSAAKKRPSDAVEQQLARYRSMRNFAVTAEPKGGSSAKATGPAAKLPFVIQKHAATRLHYDFRLGWRGVLKSWAVTKGPSYYPGDKRLAVQVEDHPIEYGGFEGIIPKGQYGGGTVMVWDQGSWEPHGDVDAGLAKGNLKFTLHGQKLKGDWVLIRMGGAAAGEKKANWLLIKEHDGNERGPDDPAVTDEAPDSVVTGRTLDEIGASQDHVWGSSGSIRQRSQQPKAAASRQNPVAEDAGKKSLDAATAKKMDEGMRDALREALPEFFAPELAVQVDEAPEGNDWLHELKLDGYRMLGRLDRAQSPPVTLLTRSGLDWTHRMPELARALEALPARTALVDGEVVVFDASGTTSFAELQAAFQEAHHGELTYVLFDLLHLDGRNLRGLPLAARKQLLEQLLSGTAAPALRYSEHLTTGGRKMFSHACQLGAEGIVSKRADSHYLSGRSGAWLKVKCIRRQEFVIGGFTLPEKSNVGLGALLLGYYRDGKLVYAGRTGTGFSRNLRIELRKRLDKLRREKPPFAPMPAAAARQAHWVSPQLVCEVQFATWTADELVRQASFQGLREDKKPEDVGREVAVPIEEVSEEESKKGKGRQTSAAVHPGTRAKLSTAAKAGDDAFPIALTHPDKQVDTETHLTKQELADYFWAVRKHMLPWIANRPLSIVRCPQGSTKPCFFQKHVTENLPDGIEGIAIRGRRSGKVENYITIDSPLGLAGLAQMGVLEIHPWGSTNKDIEKPNMIVFDLDPDEAISWETLAASALEVREALKDLKLESFLKSTGGKGLHVVAPIETEHDWPVVKAFAHGFAERMEAGNRELYLTKMTKAARKGKIYIDYLRNDRGATSIAPYSPRARHGAPVAAPMAWKELAAKDRPRLRVAEFSEWKERLRHDPWARMPDTRQRLTAAILREFSSAA
jgi:bifunctional non-homologous end joining protein LigD